MTGEESLTPFIRRLQDGEKPPTAEFARVYEELRGLARQRMASERPGHTLQATALVHEAYARLSGQGGLPWANRAHFFAAAAEAMRRILIEHARARGRLKRGGDRKRVPLESADLAADMGVEEILALDEAIRRMEEEDPTAAQVVRFRFFAGLSVEETAQAMGVSVRTVMRDWSYARAWLFQALGGRNEAPKPDQGDL